MACAEFVLNGRGDVMDEHDKRAREVLRAVPDCLVGPLTASVLEARIATALREAAQAARDAERERCKVIAASFGADEAWHPERRHAAASIADAISATPTADPAQAERARIAARFLARADEAQAEADRIRARWLEHGDRPGDADRMQRAEAVMAALRAEADALTEGT